MGRENRMDFTGTLAMSGMVTGGWRERGPGITRITGIGGYFRTEVETQCTGNSLESTKVTLAMTPSNGGYRTPKGYVP